MILIPVLLNHVIIATTSPLVTVRDPGVYSILAVIALFMVNVAVTLFPATSVTMSVYVQLLVMLVPFVNGNQSSVAVTPARLSSNVMMISELYVFQFTKPEYVGGILSIVNVAELKFPALSIASNVWIPFPVMSVHEVYGLPSIVAHERLRSLNSIDTSPL